MISPPLGSKVYVKGQRRGYVVRARDDRFAICTKPHFKTVLYFIIDVQEGVRGTENLVFGMGAETDEQCQEMLVRLTRGCEMWNGDTYKTEVSHRNRVPLDIERVKSNE